VTRSSPGAVALGAVLVIARNVVREALRRRILYLVLLFALALLVMVEGVSRFEAQIQVKMVRDFSYTIVSFFGLLLTVLITFEQVPLEVDSKTIYMILCRPITRQTFLMGKLLGILIVLGLAMTIMGGIMVAMVGLGVTKGFVIDGQVVQALYFLLLKYASFATLLMLLSIVASRPLAVMLSLLIYSFGHVSDFLRASLTASDSVVFPKIVEILDLIMPNYVLLDVPSGMVYSAVFNLQSVAILTAYALSFTVLYLVLATWAFELKEL